MIERYQDPELARIWSLEGYADRLTKASILSLQADPMILGKDQEQAEVLLQSAREMGGLDVFTWQRLEEVYQHDIAAWVELVRRQLPEGSVLLDRWHRGRTSSDLADTALAIGISESFDRLESLHFGLTKALAVRAAEHRKTPVLGKTHGQDAEWTSVGRRLAVILTQAEFAWDDIRPYEWVKMSGPVGTGNQEAMTDGSIDVAQHWLTPVASTQIVPRSYLAMFLSGLAAYSTVLSDLAMLVRLGSRTREYRTGPTFKRGDGTFWEARKGTSAPEWCREGRGAAARGSSAMPQKHNPIRSEKVSGLVKSVRSNLWVTIEAGCGLWEERDISHSSVERTAMIDALHGLAHCISTMTSVVENLEVRIPDADWWYEPTGVGAVEALIQVEGMSFEQAYEEVRSLGPRMAVGGYPAAVRERAIDWNMLGIEGSGDSIESTMWDRVNHLAHLNNNQE